MDIWMLDQNDRTPQLSMGSMSIRSTFLSTQLTHVQHPRMKSRAGHFVVTFAYIPLYEHAACSSLYHLIYKHVTHKVNFLEKTCFGRFSRSNLLLHSHLLCIQVILYGVYGDRIHYLHRMNE